MGVTSMMMSSICEQSEHTRNHSRSVTNLYKFIHEHEHVSKRYVSSKKVLISQSTSNGRGREKKNLLI